MEFPIRYKTHVIETASFKRLEQCIPAHWIVRYATERDYGIDLLVEPVSHVGGPVRGDMFALQVKGTVSLVWRDVEDPTDKKTIFSGTNKATINYWMGLPVPVFYCVHDQTTNSVLFAPVKQQIRRRYNQFKSQDTFGFELRSKLDLAEPNSDFLLMALYYQERAHPFFANALTDLLMNRDLYLDYIDGNVGRDCFLEVETPELMRFVKFYQNVQIVAGFTHIEWGIPSLSDLFAEDRKSFIDGYAPFHELTHDRGIRSLLPVFVEALEKGCQVITELEADYWIEKEYLFVQYILQRGAERWIAEVKDHLKPLLPEA